MGCLVYKNTATLTFPGSTPCITFVIFLVSPAKQYCRSKRWLANFSLVNCVFHSHSGREKSSLTHNSQLFPGSISEVSIIASQSANEEASGFSTNT